MTNTAAPEHTTHVYKTIDGCKIKADVFGAQPGARRPAVMWIHGGGLIFGTRAWVRPALLASLVQAGAVVISIDHRLAPETKLPAILDDTLDAWRWVVEQGPARFGVDPRRVAMAGGSAGAYLGLVSGLRASPRPRALVSFWGFGDITTPWESEPSRHYLGMELVSRAQALQTVGTAAISEQLPDVDRSCFYLYCRQQGRWPIEVAGHDPHAEPRWFDAYCPIRNITPDFPPTLLIHGTVDTDVPCEESENLAARFVQVGVEHEFITLEGIGHGFSGATPELAAATEQHAAAFLLARLG